MKNKISCWGVKRKQIEDERNADHAARMRELLSGESCVNSLRSAMATRGQGLPGAAGWGQAQHGAHCDSDSCPSSLWSYSPVILPRSYAFYVLKCARILLSPLFKKLTIIASRWPD